MYKLRLPIPFADDFARDCFTKAFCDTFKGFPKEDIEGLSDGQYLEIIGEGPMRAIAWWLKARGVGLAIVKIVEVKVTLKELGYLEL